MCVCTASTVIPFHIPLPSPPAWLLLGCVFTTAILVLENSTRSAAAAAAAVAKRTFNQSDAFKYDDSDADDDEKQTQNRKAIISATSNA